MAIKKFNLTKKAVGYINKMIEHVVAHPEEYNQGFFPNACTTEYCAAGHIIATKSKKLFKELYELESSTGEVSWYDEASEVIGLDTNEDEHSTIADSLFVYAESWPEKFSKQYYKAEQLKTEKARQNGMAKAFANRWKDFIKQYS